MAGEENQFMVDFLKVRMFFISQVYVLFQVSFIIEIKLAFHNPSFANLDSIVFICAVQEMGIFLATVIVGLRQNDFFFELFH